MGQAALGRFQCGEYSRLGWHLWCVNLCPSANLCHSKASESNHSCARGQAHRRLRVPTVPLALNAKSPRGHEAVESTDCGLRMHVGELGSVD